MVGERKIDIPSYTVTVDEEDSVHFSPESKIPKMLEKTKESKVETPTEAAPTEAAPTEAAPTEAAPTEAAKEDKSSTD